ncbi:MAG: mechanosensitive ion channel family protein [Actinomycetales bacterium]
MNLGAGCATSPTGGICHWVYEQTGVRWLAAVVDWFVATPVKVLVIIVVAVVARVLLHRAITNIARRAAEGSVPGVLQRGPFSDLGGPVLSERRRQRAETMGSVLRSITTGIVATIAFVMILAEVGINIAPIIASAGIVGVALGFGAQSLVKDFLSGVFMILEDQYGVGDVVDAGEASGTVEAVGLRVTRLRDVSGTVWYLPNGTIARIGNKSQGWARSVVDVTVAYGEDVEAVKQILLDTATELADEDAWRDLIIEPPEVWGVEAMTPEGLTLRVAVKTRPLQQWGVARELRARLRTALDRAGIGAPTSQRTVYIRTPDTPVTDVPGPRNEQHGD